jgi:CPA2 family monovalent cation:H+ antiporter-2
VSFETTFLVDIAILTLAALLFSLVFARFRMPVVGGQILAGVIVGPNVLKLVTDSFVISAVSQLGIILLLFILGLELDPKELRGLIAKIGGLTVVEVVISTLILFAGTFWITGNNTYSLIVAVGLAFASTAIIGRIITDHFGEKQQGERQDYQKILVSLLVIEDVIAIFFLVILPEFSGASTSSTVLSLLEIGAKGAALLAVTYLCGTYLVPWVINYFASFEIESEDVPFLFSLGLAVIFGALADYLGFSPAIGAFVIGLALRGKYVKFVSRRIRPIGDLFLILFFVSMGMLIDPFAVGEVQFFYVIIMLAIVAKFIGAWVGAKFFPTGLSATRFAVWLSPRGEFSMIIAQNSLSQGLITSGIYSVIGIVVIITALASPIYLVWKSPYKVKSEYPMGPKGDPV